ALLLDGMVPRRPDGSIAHHYTLRAPDGGPFLSAAVRGEGRFQLGVMTTSAWDDAYDVVVAPVALAALEAAVAERPSRGPGTPQPARAPDGTLAPASRTLWQVGAARIPAEGDALSLLEPLTAWLVERGRSLSARQLAEALAALAAFERSLIAQLAS